MNITQLLVRRLLESSRALAWQTQGLGMLRTYLSKEVRLHIWHRALVAPGASTIHNHPWDFESELVVGSLRNWRFSVNPSPGLVPTHELARIRCGVGGGLVEGHPPTPVHLQRSVDRPLERYSQNAEELHETDADDGTVTLVTRKFRPDEEHATVAYPVGTSWVKAEPRVATPSEAAIAVGAALLRFEELALSERRQAPEPSR